MRNKIAELKQIKDELKKLKDQEKKLADQFKEFLHNEGINRLDDSDNGLYASLTASERVVWNEDALLKTIKYIMEELDEELKEDLGECIKVKEYIDENELENIIQSGLVDIDELKDCYEIKTSYTLNIRKAGKK